jgi:hypothetical protein
MARFFEFIRLLISSSHGDDWRDHAPSSLQDKFSNSSKYDEKKGTGLPIFATELDIANNMERTKLLKIFKIAKPRQFLLSPRIVTFNIVFKTTYTRLAVLEYIIYSCFM